MVELSPVAPGAIPQYELHSLGWKGFQDLCLVVLQEELGQTLQVFRPGKDGGRDGVFRGTWKPRGGEALSGAFCVQCKHTSTAGTGLAPADIAEEIPKITRLVARQLADVYILMTNHTVTADAESKICQALMTVGVKHALVFGYDWIVGKIAASPKLRMMVPRLYGLGDLSQILDHRIYSQGKVMIDDFRDDLARFVATESYKKSAWALDQRGFVILVGEAGSGKSTIAKALMITALDSYGILPMIIPSGERFKDHWNPHEPNQFLFVDDAFGANTYEPALAREWNIYMPEVLAAVKRGMRVVMTSRDYIFEPARRTMRLDRFAPLADGKVVIKVEDLTSSDRADLLYNHIRLGNQSREWRTSIKRILPRVASVPHLLPEVVRRLALQQFTARLSITEDDVLAFAQKPEDYLHDVIERLGKDELAALALLFLHGGKIPSPLMLGDYDRAVLEVLGSSLNGVTDALAALRGSMVHLEEGASARGWRFKHPSEADAMGAFLRENPELCELYLRGASVDRLISYACALNGEPPRGRMFVPVACYPIVVQRLVEAFKKSFSGKRHQIIGFLDHQCSDELLCQFVGKFPEVFQDVDVPQVHLVIDAWVGFMARCMQVDLVPTETRIAYLASLRKVALEAPDASIFEHPRIGTLMTAAERAELLKEFRLKHIPGIEATADEWELEEHDTSDSAEPLLGTLKALEKLLGASDEAGVEEDLEAVIEARSVLERRIEGESWEPDHDDWRDYSSQSSSVGYESFEQRSQFDDVDA